MKINKKMTLRGGAALLALISLVSASAFLITSGNKIDSVSGDSAIVLTWGEKSDAAIESLSPSAPAYREVTGSWSKSTSVKGYAKFTFTLSTSDKISVRISNKSFSTEGFKSTDVLYTLYDSETTTYSSYVSLDAETIPTYYLEFTTSDNEVKEISGTLTISLDYSANKS